MSILYAMVAETKEKKPLVEYADCEGNVQMSARDVLSSIKKSGFNCMKVDERYMFSYNMDDKITTLAMSNKMNPSVLSAFLTRVRKEFDERYTVNDSETKLKNFAKNIKDILKEFNSKNNKLNLVDKEMNDLEENLIQTQKKLLDRDEHIQLLVKKTDDMLLTQSNMYTGAVQARNELWWRRFRNHIIIGVVIFIVVLILYFWLRSFF